MSDDDSRNFIGVLIEDPDVQDDWPKLPHKEEGNNGWDLFSIEDCELKPGERMPVDTGLRCDFPSGIYGLIWPRSGLAVKEGIDVLAGLIDESYQGRIKVVLINHSDRTVLLPKGSKIAQMIIQREVEIDFDYVSHMKESGRGEKGFGSSGL